VKPTQEKHRPYFAVLEALRESTICFLCALEEKSLRRYMDSLLYERVNDPGVRADLKFSHGFCHHHAHLMAGMGNAFCAALLYQDHVSAFEGVLGKHIQDGDKQLSADFVETWTSHAACPACRLQAGDRVRYIATLIDNLGHDDMRAAFETSAPLCIPHLGMALRETQGKAHYQLLFSVQHEAWTRLSGELEEFIRKQTTVFRRNPWAPKVTHGSAPSARWWESIIYSRGIAT
jgi:hypothetical protein